MKILGGFFNMDSRVKTSRVGLWLKRGFESDGTPRIAGLLGGWCGDGRAVKRILCLEGEGGASQPLNCQPVASVRTMLVVCCSLVSPVD